MTEQHRIRLRPKLPIRGDAITLRFGILELENIQDPTLPESCDITLQPDEEMKWTNLSIQAVCDNTNQEFSPTRFTFSVISFHDFWFSYELPPITVSHIVFYLIIQN